MSFAVLYPDKDAAARVVHCVAWVYENAVKHRHVTEAGHLAAELVTITVFNDVGTGGNSRMSVYLVADGAQGALCWFYCVAEYCVID